MSKISKVIVIGSGPIVIGQAAEFEKGGCQMRRSIGIAMVIFGLGAALTGIWQLFPPFNEGPDPMHLTAAFPFAIVIVIHVWLNRRPAFRYFTGLRLRWILVGLGFVYVVWVGIIGPMFVF